MARATQFADETAKRKVVEKAHDALKKAKTKKDVVAVWEHENYGYLILGHKMLARLLIGKTVEEALRRRGGE